MMAASFELLLTLPKPVPLAQFSVCFNAARFGRRPHASDTHIDECWAEKLAGNPKLFDGPKFRLEHVGCVAGGDAVCANVGLTTYREYLGTHRRPLQDLEAMRRDGQARFGDPNAHLSLALGVESVLQTSDGKVVLLRRSQLCGTDAGLFNGPSGHPEPEKAKLVYAVGESAPEDAASRAARELFGSPVDEICEETGVAPEALDEPLLIGAMCDSFAKPDLLFLVRTRLSAEEVRACYAKGAPEGWESDKFEVLPLPDFVAGRVPGHLAPTTLAAAVCVGKIFGLAA
eukprot:NODE_17643_length_933_cov_2.890819.p2 GENE.NODE_17643_length_933_cov_2.890819~~NODE_17643_length_933_cov_2.890819.p2  ORF type:complete len:287 (+),score=68.39 NODE_17643_length_933_cov_2.890819:65-925(+)